MDFKDYFVPYRKEIDSFLTDFFLKESKKAGQITPAGEDLLKKLEGLIGGGKRIRGGLVKLGYECFKKDKGLILPIAAAVEITQGAILVHDDIIDQSPLRHGHPTVHQKYETYHRKNYRKGNALHYGESMAIVVGIAGYYSALRLLIGSKFDDRLIKLAVDELARFMSETCFGEALDVDLAYHDKIKEKEVLTIHSLKTAQYTLVGPLRIGGILAGASEKQLKSFSDFGVPVGVAFQLQDDILGMFGASEKTGKPVDDDIKEGKNTLLYTKAFEKGTASQKKRLVQLWGKKEITKEEFSQAQKIITTTGSLDYSKALARKLVEKGSGFIPALTRDKSLQEVFITLTDFIIAREK